MGIYVTGDCHGRVIERFSDPMFDSLTENDYVIVAGDFGGLFHDNENDYQSVSWLGEQKWNTIIVLGNHEDWDLYEEMPFVCNGVKPDFWERGGLKEFTYRNLWLRNVWVVYDTAILNIDGKRILCIAGAESNDRSSRVPGFTWWPQERIDAGKVFDALNGADREFDFVITHDAPARINDWYHGGSKWYYNGIELGNTFSELVLEQVFDSIKFDKWIHGHFHFNGSWNYICETVLKRNTSAIPDCYSLFAGVYKETVRLEDDNSIVFFTSDEESW